MNGPLERSPLDETNDGVNLRAWFVCFLLWLAGLVVAARWGLVQGDAGKGGLGLAVYLFAIYAFYLSLCCTFIPAPTTWVVQFVASDAVASAIGLGDRWAVRLLAVASIGALATAMANLNEYHIFTYLLRHRRIARVRQTRLYGVASDWFRTSPFWVIALFSFLPIPVDVIRWLAITDRYPRPKFFGAYYVGRWLRYAVWGLTAVGLHLTPWQIGLFQVGLVVIALGKIVPRFIRHLKGGEERPSESFPVVKAEASSPIEQAS